MNLKYGIIGGTGLYQMDKTTQTKEVDIPTPFGMPSDCINIVELEGTEVAFLSRHGQGHRLLPTEVPSRANIWALKSLGVGHIVSISAVGSLNEKYKPGDLVLCTQLIDRTHSRDISYFGAGIVGHVGFADPFCQACNTQISQLLKQSGVAYHNSGTLLTMEGPLFSTRAESHMYRSWNADIIGMTALPEAKLAREAEICFSVIAMVTDYDCWREAEESVTLDMVLDTMAKNVKKIRNLIPGIIKALEQKEPCSCHTAAQYAVVTNTDRMPYETKRKLGLFYNKYWK